jgi:uncharacterized membrane protein SpoIIM required for sporulation
MPVRNPFENTDWSRAAGRSACFAGTVICASIAGIAVGVEISSFSESLVSVLATNAIAIPAELICGAGSILLNDTFLNPDSE